MKIYKEENLRSFEFWAGARETAEHLTLKELDKMEEILEELYPDGMTETQINDIFWFKDNWIAEMLGYNNFAELVNRKEE